MLYKLGSCCTWSVAKNSRTCKAKESFFTLRPRENKMNRKHHAAMAKDFA